MTRESNQPSGAMTYAESLVQSALMDLPGDFTLISGGTRLRYRVEDRAISYEPDFELRDLQGRALFIEVKAGDAISLPSMVRLAQLNKRIRSDPGRAFMLLIWGDSRIGSRLALRPEFEQLVVRTAADFSEVRKAVLDVFASAFPS